MDKTDIPISADSIPCIDLNFDTLWLAIGDDRYAFPLNRSEDNAQQGAAKTSKKAPAQDAAQSTEPGGFDESDGDPDPKA